MEQHTLTLTKLLLSTLLSIGIFSAQAEQSTLTDNLPQPQANWVMPDSESSLLDSQISDNSAPVRKQILSLDQLIGNLRFSGSDNIKYINFNVRKDEVITSAILRLNYTPSPMLMPTHSHFKVYLNDRLTQTVNITESQLGEENSLNIVLDYQYITDYNVIRLEFIGSYDDACWNPMNPGLWLEISKSSELNLLYQKLLLKNDLAFFPLPFFDARDSQRLNLPITFVEQPTLKTLQAAGLLASWFGTQAQWRGAEFSTYINQLPEQDTLVFIKNLQKPTFLPALTPVDKPTIKIMTHPQHPYRKLLLIMGRDDDDLLMAVKGIAQGNILFRGEEVTFDNVEKLADRVPYDAPNWISLQRKVTFSELQPYAERLQMSGKQYLPPIDLDFRLPPDVFSLGQSGINMILKYRYSAPMANSQSRLNIQLNNQFVKDVRLSAIQDSNSGLLQQIPLVSNNSINRTEYIEIPPLKLAEKNRLQFNFAFYKGNEGVSSEKSSGCSAPVLPDYYALIDGDSTIDLSAYRHYMAMPNLRAFIQSAFPFSRMADLSETVILIDTQPVIEQINLLFNTLARFGGQIGYPALGMTLTDEWQGVEKQNSDLLIVGNIPSTLMMDRQINLLLATDKNWIKQPTQQSNAVVDGDTLAANAAITSQVTLNSQMPIAGILGLPSPYHAQRSMVILSANQPAGYALLNRTLNDSQQQGAIWGSMAVIRDSGIESQQVGDIYYVGYLPWWEFIWYQLAAHPVLLAGLSLLSVILMAMVLWRVLRILSHRRLQP